MQYGWDRVGETSTMLLHASAISFQTRGLLITGPSGSGKSSLALNLMAFGASLVSDDQTELVRKDDYVWANAPSALFGKIEARGIGILAVEPAPKVRIDLVVDLSKTQSERIPTDKTTNFLGIDIPTVHKSEMTAFPAALIQYLRGGKVHL